MNVLMCRVRAPQRGENVSGLATRQKAKLGRILEQVHSDIITERQRGTYIHVCIGHTLRTMFPLKGERGALPPPLYQANNYKGQSTDQVNIAQNQS